MHKNFDPAILKCKGQIRARAAVAVINFFPLHMIVVLNNEYGAQFNLFLQINWIHPDLQRLHFSFFSCWYPVYR